MAGRIKIRGTTDTMFEIGLSPRFRFDTSELSTNETWLLPPGATEAGSVLTNNGLGGLSWQAPGASSDTTVPYLIPVSTSFSVLDNKQALFQLPITIDGSITVDGILLEV